MSNDQKKIVSASAAEPLGAELERLLQPTRYFQHPRDVVRDAILTTAEKRAILSSWASDASAVESMPALRQILGSGHVVKFDEVIDALQELDGKADDVGMEEPRRGASVLSALRLEPLGPFPLSSPARFSRSLQEPG